MIRGLSFCSATRIYLAVPLARRPIYLVSTKFLRGNEARGSEVNASATKSHPRRTRSRVCQNLPRHLAKALLQAQQALPPWPTDPTQGRAQIHTQRACAIPRRAMKTSRGSSMPSGHFMKLHLVAAGQSTMNWSTSLKGLGQYARWAWQCKSASICTWSGYFRSHPLHARLTSETALQRSYMLPRILKKPWTPASLELGKTIQPPRA